MCGIFGFTGPPDPELAAAMLSRLRHRGPDGDGLFSGPDITLGATRLAIVGVDNGAQPITNESGDVTLVANAEIYNHRELRAELEARGHRFATDSDCEPIAHLYEELGQDCVAALEGMFAFALWDARRRCLLLARDRLGIKPLVWTEHGGRLLFASEAKALLAAPGVRRTLDPAALDALLQFGFVPGDRTLFAGIRRALPAQTMLFADQQPLTRRYWRSSVAAQPGSEIGDPPGALLRVLERSVASHLAREVPQGFLLSGGLDSSLLVALAERLTARPLRTYSLGAPGAGDERRPARQVAEHCRSEHHEIELAPADLLARLPSTLWDLEEPRPGPAIAYDKLAQRAADDVKVLLVGEGADELLGGYLRLKTVAGPLAWLPAELASRLFLGRSALLWGRRGIYRPEFLRRLPAVPLGGEELARVFAVAGAERRARVLAFEQEVALPASHLARVDLQTMAHSVEARVPYLDREVVELANRLPMRWKLRLRGEKLVLREAARGLLPDAIRCRPKHGLRDPLALWRGRELHELARELLDESVVQRRGYFRERYLRPLRRGAARAHGTRPFAAAHLHHLLLIEIWHRLFLDPAVLAPPPGRRDGDHRPESVR